MRLIVIREQNDAATSEKGVLRYALSTQPLPGVIVNGAYRLCGSIDGTGGFSKLVGGTHPDNLVWVFPASWHVDSIMGFGENAGCVLADGFDLGRLGDIRNHPWFMISDGRYAAHISDELSEKVLSATSAGALAVTAASGLRAYQERIRLTERGDLVGYRRLYRDSAEPTPLSAHWPHHLVIRSEHVETLLSDGLPEDFSKIVEKCRACGIQIESVSMAGSVVDLSSPDGLSTLSELVLAHCSPRGATLDASLGRQVYTYDRDHQIASDVKFTGPVLVGRGVRIESEAVVVGPSILCDGCTVGRAATVDSSIVGAAVTVEPDRALNRCIVTGSGNGSSSEHAYPLGPAPLRKKPLCPRRESVFRSWPRLSYAGCYKRIVDVILATIVLILFAPIMPLIALAIKINSPGPVFFKDKRQGLHGRPFDCIKFRTMRVGAAEIQDKLRFVSEVDGPQFKMADDPRISAVGHFLRETYLDEIPQFFNVLCGQMSLVGPRPSPEKENTLCPSWRDARLSVRPGISGLWQVFRTREPFKDFQEWIFYDTKYVQELSPRMDLWVCWCTFRKMVDNFIRQF